MSSIQFIWRRVYDNHEHFARSVFLLGCVLFIFSFSFGAYLTLFLTGPTLDQHRKLDQLYREDLKAADAEKKIHEEYDLANSLAIYQSLTTPDEPPARNGATTKGSRSKAPRTSNDIDVVIDSPVPSPGETRDVLKRVKGTTQRSSSVASAARSAAPRVEEGPENNRGLIAEKAGQLVIGTEVFYKLPKGTPEEEGAGIQCIIKKIYHDKKP
jgi:hypothetical protein